jgi:hypothetical protein
MVSGRLVAAARLDAALHTDQSHLAARRVALKQQLLHRCRSACQAQHRPHRRGAGHHKTSRRTGNTPAHPPSPAPVCTFSVERRLRYTCTHVHDASINKQICQLHGCSLWAAI